MFSWLAPYLTSVWGPFRLLGFYLVLIGTGATAAAVLVWFSLPRLWQHLPRDRGRRNTPKGEVAKGKPTGAGLVLVVLLMPVLFFVVPPSVKIWQVTGCLFLAMVTGYLDDRSAGGWGELLKGSLDLAIALLASLAMCQGRETVIWLPFFKGEFPVSPFLYVPVATVLLWITINATNCSDGVDGLAGTLTMLSLFYLGGFLYVVIGRVDFAAYLLVPHDPEGAKWAVLIFTAAGGLAGYLWYNAEPSGVLMGDAGSRFLGLLVGVAVLATGNPFVVLVVAPVALVNGGTGLAKVALLRCFRRLGFDVRPPDRTPPQAVDGDARSGGSEAESQHVLIRLLHSVRFPLHDHCRRNLGWHNPQVLMRFVLIQTFLTPLLLGLLVKLR